MKLFNQFTLTLGLCALFWAFLGTQKLKAQVSYLEGIGTTEIELLSFLDREDEQPFVQRNGSQLSVEGEGLRAVYHICRGKVISITFYEFFPSEQEAVAAYHRSLDFLDRRGITVAEVRRKGNYRVSQGQGSGVNAHLMVVPVGQRYRLDAGLSCI